MELAGRQALVTGAGQGFGEGIARALAGAGASVTVADRNSETGSAVAEAIGGRFIGVDVADPASVAAMAEAVPVPDILVNNAGITHLPTPLEEVDEAAFDRVFAVNCKSVYLTARAFVPAMKDRGSGVILNIASTAGLSPRPQLNWYNASKGWMVTATKTMAVELAPSGIRVNALCPVAGETPLLPSFLGGDTAANRARFLATIPLGRFSTPGDLGAAALFLCSDSAAMITGAALEVDGGRCI